LNEDCDARYNDLDAFLELAKNGSLCCKKASDELKRHLADILISNVIVEENKVASVSLQEPFAGWAKSRNSSESRNGG